MMLSADGTALVHARRLDHDFCPAVPKTPRKKPHHSSVFIVKRNSHVSILFSAEESGGLWFHTRGMRKFGRPDLSLHNVPDKYEKAAIELCNRFIELQAAGGRIPDGQEIQMPSLPGGLVCRHKGSLDDPDFNNVHVEIQFPANR